ncbi:MAG: diguanylate cyclase [Pseudomonadota bacterium]
MRVFQGLAALALTGLYSPVALSAASGPQAGDVLRFGVFSYLGEEQTRRQYQPIADYLTRRLAPHHVVLEVLPQAEIDRRVADGSLDLVTTNPTHFLHARAQQPLSGVIATLVELDHGQPLYRLGGVMLTRAARTDIAGLDDVRGKIIGTPGLVNLGGYRAQAYELLRAGVTLPREARAIVQLGTHEAVVRAVVDGRVEVGFVRSGVLEKMRASGEVRADEVRVIRPLTHPGYPLIASTRLYPEWPVFALPHVDESVVRKVAAALFELEPDDPAARVAGIYGYTIPADYLAIEDLTRSLRLPPYERAPDFTVRDVFQRWSGEFLIALFGMLIIAALVALLLQVLRRETLLRTRHQRLLNSLGEGVYDVDTQGNCTFINRAALQMIGMEEGDVLGRDQHALFHHHRPGGESYPVQECPVDQTLRDGQERRLEEWFFRADGEGFPVDLTVSPIWDRERVTGAVVVFRDITEHKRLERELIEMATTDGLTGLPNRRHFMEMAGRQQAHMRRMGGRACLLMIDIDHFKEVNDRHGHAAGDEVLRIFADILRANLRQMDIAGRIGGEEFAALLPDTALDEGAEIAERLRVSLEGRCFEVSGVRLRITISVGCVALDGETLIDEVLASADRALYRAKEEGRNRVVTT